MGWHHFFFFLLFFSSCFLWRGWVAEGSHVVYPEYMNYEASEESGNIAIGRRHRTGYHFQPKEHWINDPNGPMYYNGYYHLFYQYNPKGAVWGNIVWAHSISTDLINWNHLPPAIYPSKPFDINGCWSGSATILPGKGPAILYTGIDPDQRQVQNIAFPANLSDPYLVEWTKPDYNPVIPPGAGINASAFRDPTTAWRGEDGVWRLLIGTKRKHHHSAELYWGVASLYRSKDFIRWVEAKHPLHASPRTGMWECPDFFPVALEGRRGVDTSVAGEGYKHVLKVSLDLTRFEYYTVGKYDQKTDRYVPDGTSADDRTGLRFDYGNFYASKTFFDPEKKRRILWGWANESDSTMTDIAKGWAGIQTIPRAVWLDKSGRQLVQWPVKELESLRQNEVKVQGVKLSGGSIFQVQGIESSEADVEVSFHVRGLEEAEPWDPTWSTGDPQQLCWVRKAKVRGGVGPFGLLVLASADLSERTAVFFRVFKDLDKYKVLMCHDPTSSTTMEKVYKPTFGGFVDIDIAKHKKISLRSLVDNSVVESFGDGGKTCITSRVYPLVALGSDARIFAFNNGTSDIEIAQLRAWEMGRPQIS